jgi:carboxypeptidase Q
MKRHLALGLAIIALGTTIANPGLAQRGGGGAGAAGGGRGPLPPVKPVTFPSDDAVIKRIWSVGMDSSWTMKLGQVFLDSIGPRLTGSPGMKSASDWVIKQYQSWGIEAKAEQYGTWRGWRRGYSHIDLIAPRVRTLEGTMLGWSPGTNKQDLDADVIVLPALADSNAFKAWLPQVRGKAVMVSAAMPTCRPIADYQQWATAWSAARMDSARAAATNAANARLRATGLGMQPLALGTGLLGDALEAAGAAAVLTSRPKDAWGTIEIFETYNLRAPGIALSCEDYGLLYRLAENNQRPRIRLNLDAELLGEVPAFNTIGTIKGSTLPNEYVMFSAHFDSWDGSSGATDNGTGTLMMMEAMRILKKVYPNPKRTIMVGHWSSEEQGLNGSRAYAQDHPEILKGLQALFNQDNGTGRVQRVSGSGLPNMEVHGRAWFSKLPDYFTDSVTFSFNNTAPTGVGGTDGAVFTCYGTPSFGMGALGFNYNAYTWHTNRDTYDKVWFDDLKQNATLVAMLAYLASEDPSLITRERSPGPWIADCGAAPRTTRRR